PIFVGAVPAPVPAARPVGDGVPVAGPVGLLLGGGPGDGAGRRAEHADPHPGQQEDDGGPGERVDRGGGDLRGERPGQGEREQCGGRGAGAGDPAEQGGRPGGRGQQQVEQGGGGQRGRTRQRRVQRGAEVPELAGRPVGERRNAQHTAHGERRDQDEQSGGEGGGDPPGPQPGGVDGAGVPVAAHAVPPDTEPNPVTRPIPRGNADNRRWQGFAGRAGRGNGRRRGGKRTEAPRR